MVPPFGVKGSHELLEYVHCRGVLKGELALELHDRLSSDINLSQIKARGRGERKMLERIAEK